MKSKKSKVELLENEQLLALVPSVSDHGYKRIDVFVGNWATRSFRCVTLGEEEMDDDTLALFKSACCLSNEFRNTISFERKK
jgi:hypothetical protein